MKLHSFSVSLDNHAARERIQSELNDLAANARESGETLAAVLQKTTEEMTPTHPYFFLQGPEFSIMLGHAEVYMLKTLGYKLVMSMREANEKIKAWDDAVGSPDSLVWVLGVHFNSILLYCDIVIDDMTWNRPGSIWQRMHDWGFTPQKEMAKGDVILYHSAKPGTVNFKGRDFVWCNVLAQAALCVEPGIVESKLGGASGIYHHPVKNVTADTGTHYVVWRPPKVLVQPKRMRNVTYSR